jgi:acetoin utilization deacetylase AcuC-like enzyme
MGPVLLRHPSSLRHDPGPHPERPARIGAIERTLAEHAWLGFEVRSSPAAARDALLAVHPASHLELVERTSAAGGGMLDADTILSAGSWEAALHGAGGAVAAVDAVLGEGASFAASLHRPPGHHCETARAMGFCLLSNAAIAARWARDAHGIERVLVLDWDVHHGNGTEQVFWSEPGVLFCSIHESPLYPGTGAEGDIGVGEGTGFTVNLPVPEGSGDAVFTSLVAHVVGPLVRSWRPGLVLVSAGFDAHAADPLAGCAVGDEGFAAMAATVRSWGVPTALVLEGGYDLVALSRGVLLTLEALGGRDVPAVPEPALHPLAERALERLAASPGPRPEA